MNATTFGFGSNDTGIGGRTTKFKAEKGKTYRLGFAWWPGMDSGDVTEATLTPKDEDNPEELTPCFIRAPQNYVPGVGYFINKGPEYTKLAGEAPKMKIATIIVKWELGPKGQPTKETLFNSLPEVMPWIISGDKYEKLKKMHLSGYPMHEWDIQADCEDAQFQKLTFLPAKQCIFKEMLKNKNERAQEIANHIIQQVQAMAPNLEREIGQDLTLDKLREKMGHDAPQPVGNVVAGDDEVDDVLGSLMD